MNAAILHGVRVVELASGIAVPAAGLQLSEAGADVVRIEPPGGDPEQDSNLFCVLNRGKQRLTLSLDDAQARHALHLLLARADVFIHDLVPALARNLGLDDEALKAAYPQLIIAPVSGWPKRHPCADAPPRDTLVLAKLGLMDEQPGHRPGPIFIRMPFASWLASWFCATGVIARLIARRRDGRGGVARTSLAQAALAPMSMHWARAERPTPVFAKGLGKDTPIPLHRCVDGQWIHVHYSPDKAPWMAEALAAMGAEAVAAENAKFPPSHVAPNFGANKAIIATRTAEEWARHFWEHDVAAQVVAPFGAIYRDEQARANNYVVAQEDTRLGTVWRPGLPYHTEPPPRLRGALAALQDDAEQVLARWAAMPKVEAVQSISSPFAQADTGEARRPPLAGLKVLDLGAYLAGPFAAMLLADLGADVIKVEPPEGDAMRRLERIFAGTQRGKSGVALKLGDPRAKDALTALVQWADIVHHNIRLPAARKLGADDAALRAIRPDLVFCHISSYGPAGERKDWPGFDQLMQAACGWEAECGGEGNPPMWLRFGVGDYLAALSSLFALLLAHYHRLQTGKGQAVSASLLGATVLTVAETSMLADGTMTGIEHLDAAQNGLSPDHRMYRCKDGWIVVAAVRAGEKAAFARSMPADQREARLAGMTREAALADLHAAGVPAEAVLEDQALAFHEDAGHRRAGLHANYSHAVYGRLEQVGAFWDFDDLPLSLERAPPALGEHSREVWEMLGLSAAQIQELEAHGLTRPCTSNRSPGKTT